MPRSREASRGKMRALAAGAAIVRAELVRATELDVAMTRRELAVSLTG